YPEIALPINHPTRDARARIPVVGLLTLHLFVIHLYAMKRPFAVALISLLFLFSMPAGAQTSTQSPPAKPAQAESPKLSPRDAALWQRALAIHRSSIVVDTHNDILSFMIDDNYDIGVSSAGKYHTDLACMKQGGLTAEFFSVYIDRKYATEGGSARRALDMIDYVYRAVEQHPRELMWA